MCSRLQSDETSRYLLKCLLHRFRCRRHFLFQKDFARFIQNAVERPAIAKVQTNRELVSFENHVSIYPNGVSLFHGRSPFLCALSTSNLGSVSHPAGDRPSHPICEVRFSECGIFHSQTEAIIQWHGTARLEKATHFRSGPSPRIAVKSAADATSTLSLIPILITISLC